MYLFAKYIGKEPTWAEALREFNYPQFCVYSSGKTFEKAMIDWLS